MHIQQIHYTGNVHTTGDLTGDARIVHVSPPIFTVRLDPGETVVAENPEAWVEPLHSDAVVDALVEAYRAWLIAKR
jgi:hypothetical protein